MSYRNQNRGDQGRASYRERDDGYNRNMRGRDDGRAGPKHDDPASDPLLSSEWTHDRYEDEDDHRANRKRQPYRNGDQFRAPVVQDNGFQITIRGLPYEITRPEIKELCERFGLVSDVNLLYDRTDRSTGVAHITFEDLEEARIAVDEIDGAKAYGQTVHATLRAPPPKRSLSDRIEYPAPASARRTRDPYERNNDSDGYESRTRGPRNRSRSPIRDHARATLDRYVPPHRGGRDHRERSPREPLRARNGGNRVERNGRRGDRGGRRGGRSERPKKTQEDLDAELDGYFAKAAEGGEAAKEAPAAETAAPATFMHDDMELDL